MENDSLKVNYNQETGEINLEWDPNDSKWNWLSSMTEEELRNIITKHFESMVQEHESDN